MAGKARKLAEYATVPGYTLVAYDPFLPQEFFAKYGARQVDLDELFRTSDVISVHAPATPETKMVALAGYDFAIIDLEHAGINDDVAEPCSVPRTFTACPVWCARVN